MSEASSDAPDNGGNNLWERLARNEAAVEYLDRDMRQLSADMKRIEDKVDDHHAEQHAQIEEISKGIRRNMWLFVGGWAALTAVGGFLLWAVRMGDGLVKIFGG